ncbi:hypothetical protein [Microbacterium halotolerans]|uniref:hypothetical protein n=1 Tax=Microbacterium halotolerans TaxID=246613 RepID=UPI000E6AB61E|nr:hypothetical protein [Microbacterium halotolerans]
MSKKTHTTLFGKLTDNTSSILRYSDEERTYEIFTPWKNGKSQFTLKRDVDTVPYDDLTAYATGVEGDTKHKSGLGRAAGLGILFGGAGAIVGAITGRREYERVQQITLALRTSSGDEYQIPIFYAMKGEKATSSSITTALEKLKQIAEKLEATGASLDENWTTKI